MYTMMIILCMCFRSTAFLVSYLVALNQKRKRKETKRPTAQAAETGPHMLIYNFYPTLCRVAMEAQKKVTSENCEFAILFALVGMTEMRTQYTGWNP